MGFAFPRGEVFVNTPLVVDSYLSEGARGPRRATGVVFEGEPYFATADVGETDGAALEVFVLDGEEWEEHRTGDGKPLRGRRAARLKLGDALQVVGRVKHVVKLSRARTQNHGQREGGGVPKHTL